MSSAAHPIIVSSSAAKLQSTTRFSPPFSRNISPSPGTRTPLVPAIYHDANYRLQKPSEDLESFLRCDLDVTRLNKVHLHLWLAGRPMAARPLHRQTMMGREIVATEQADLHLVWSESRIFIKPLPTYLLDRKFWDDHLCARQDLYESAYGFLLSYAWLVCHESDFYVATNTDEHPNLLPSGLTWIQWTIFLEDFLTKANLNNPYLDPINKRYHYGELREGRLNIIYRLAPNLRFQHFIRGYYNEYNQYQVFFRRNFAWLIVIFAYVTIVLTAMQVGLATPRLSQDIRFQRASYGFAVFSIITLASIVGMMLVLFLVLFTNNFVATLLYDRKHGGIGSKSNGHP